jgi:hypothetical protein
MRSALAAGLLALGPLCAAAADEAESVPPAWKLSGYYKNLLTRSRTVFPAGEPYTADLNRLRLKIEGKPAANLAIDLQYDNEVLLGSYLRTAQFRLQKALPPPTYWSAQDTYADRSGFHGQHRLYRAALTWSQGTTDVRIGRQRVAWGTGRFFSPLEILKPVNPITLERGERIGVDALLVEHKVDALSRFGAVYAPQHDPGRSSAAALWHGNHRGVDYSLVAGRFGRQDVVGVDFAGQIGQAGIRAEATHTRRPTGSGYTRILVGLDYAFANTLSLSGELYRDGSGARDLPAYDFAALFAGRVQNLGRRYAAAHAGYEITPLLKANTDLVANLGDSSHYLSPSLTYSVRSNLDATLGIQFFRGRAGTEYGTFRDVVFAQLVWFF